MGNMKFLLSSLKGLYTRQNGAPSFSSFLYIYIRYTWWKYTPIPFSVPV